MTPITSKSADQDTAVDSCRQPLRGVLLDIDGTLLDSNDAHAQAWCRAMRDGGHAVAYEAVRSRIGKGGDKLLPEVLGIESDSPEGERLNESRANHFKRDFLPQLQPTAGARNLLERLLAEGFALVVATSASGEELAAVLKRARVEDLIAVAASSSDASESKPDPNIIQAALRKAKLEPHDVVMLGDTPYDVEAARAAGVDTIALRCGGRWKDADFHGAAAVFDDPASLLGTLETSPLWRGRPC